MTRPSPPAPTLPARCLCPARGAVIAVRPGCDAVRLGATDIVTRREALLEIPIPDQFWCAACAPWFKVAEVA